MRKEAPSSESHLHFLSGAEAFELLELMAPTMALLGALSAVRMVPSTKRK